MDSLPGIAEAYRDVFQYLGVEFPGMERIKSFIGPNVQIILNEVVGLKGKQLSEAVSVFRSSYGDGKYLNYRKYPGVDEMLKELRDAGRKLFVATSKMQTMASDLIGHAGWSTDFFSVAGVNPERNVNNKHDVLSHVLSYFNLESKMTVMVGDRVGDLESARQLKIYSIGVLWGYGSREEVSRANPDVIVEQIAELGGHLNRPCE